MPREIKELEPIGYGRAACYPERPVCFSDDWYSPSPTLVVHIGLNRNAQNQSTVLKEQMIKSAQLTCDYLQLSEGRHRFVMHAVQLRNTLPANDGSAGTGSGFESADQRTSGTRWRIFTPLRFAAMIPAASVQLTSKPAERQALCDIEQSIIRGGAINSHWKK